MVISISNLVDTFPERIHKAECKYGHDNIKYQTSGIKYKDCECCLEHTNVLRCFNRIQMFIL